MFLVLFAGEVVRAFAPGFGGGEKIRPKRFPVINDATPIFLHGRSAFFH